MAENSTATIIARSTGTLSNGEEFAETLRVPATLWRKLGGKDTQKGEEGLATWLRAHNPRFGPDLTVTFIREESTKTSQMMVRPEL